MSVQGAKILVVEDEAIVAMDIKLRLSQLGYEVPRVVAMGEEAFQAAEELKPELVLMDISLKGHMPGTEAAQRIHSELDIPIVFLTAYADENTLEKAKASEPFGYITKPFEDSDLRVAIELALYKAKAEKERKELMSKLQKAMDEVKTLSGLIPICASCKKIRDDKGYWQAVEQYIGERTSAEFTHGICPECMQKLYPGMIKDIDPSPHNT
jgi:two-component system, response regulator PdtaR